jgi:hypothetical protein
MLFYKNFEDYLCGERERLERLASSQMPDLGAISRILTSTPPRSAEAPAYPTTRETETLEVDAMGITGDRHRAVSRPSTGRESTLYKKGTVIRQHRHLCLVTEHDCRLLSARLGVEVTPELLGADLVIEAQGSTPFSIADLPPGTHLLVYPPGAKEVPKPPIATLVHHVKQQGCGVTGKAIADHYGDKSLVKAFRDVSRDNRASICSVEFPAQEKTLLRAGQQIAFRYSRCLTP